MSRDRVPHQVVVAMSYDGFRAICTCGWRSPLTELRQLAARARDDHKRRSQLRSVP